MVQYVFASAFCDITYAKNVYSLRYLNMKREMTLIEKIHQIGIHYLKQFISNIVFVFYIRKSIFVVVINEKH